MPSYAYKAVRPDGSTTDGSLEAASRQAALASLGQQGLQPYDLAERSGGAPAKSPAKSPSPAAAKAAGSPFANGSASASSVSASGSPSPAAAPSPSVTDYAARLGLDLKGLFPARGVSAKTLEAFTRQLASLLRAGVPLAPALQLLAREAPDDTARGHWLAVHTAVTDGASLAAAMEQHPEVFPRVYVAMIQAGETGGFLDVVLRQIADFQTLDRDLRGRVKAALIYPAVLATLSVAVLIFLMVFFIPRFQGIFADFGAALPPLTRVIVNTSVAMKTYGILALPVVIIGVAMARRYLATPAGSLQFERLILRLPVIGSVAARFAMTRFCRMLGTLTRAGVPLINALRVARESLGNAVLSDAVTAAITRVQHGERLGVSLADCKQLFPASIIAMVSVAEQSGQLDEELMRIADESEQELDRHLRSAVALAEPILLFVMAGFIGLIVIGMVLPIFTIQDYIK